MALDAVRFENILQSQSLESHWITGITDNKGIILARSERHADFVGKPLPKELLEQSRAATGVFRATNVEGHEILRGTVRSGIAGWLVSATVPVSHLGSSRRRGQGFAVAMIVTALGLGAASRTCLLHSWRARFKPQRLPRSGRTRGARRAPARRRSWRQTH